MPTLLYPHRRAPVAAATAAGASLSPASIALCIVGVVSLVVAASITSFFLWRRKRNAHARQVVSDKQQQQKTGTSDAATVATTPTTTSIPTHPAITLDPATPALPSQQEQTRAPVRISQLPVSTSSSTLGSALPDEDPHHEEHDRERAVDVSARRESTPFAGPASGIVDVPQRESTPFDAPQPPATPTRRDSRHRSRPIPSDVLKSLGELPSLPPGPSPIARRSTSNDSPSRALPRSVDSMELTPVLDLASNFRIASGIFGDSMSQNLWLSSVLDSAFQGGNSNSANSRTVSPTKGRNDTRQSQHLHQHHQHTALTPSASLDSLARRRSSSSRIPVSRSQRQYLDQDPHAEMRTFQSSSDVSAASHHLSTRPSHGLTENTAPTSVASTDSLSAAASSDVQVFRADLAHKLPATTMRASQVFPSVRQARHAAAESSNSSPTASSSPASSRAESPQRRRKPKSKRKSEAASQRTTQQSLLAAPPSGLKSVSETDLTHTASAKDIMMHSLASSVSITAPFTTPFHRAVFPDEPMSCDDGRQDSHASNGRDSLAPTPSPVVAQFSSTTPKMSPKASFASAWKSKLARSVTLHASPQMSPSHQLSYVKSRSNLNLGGGGSSAAGMSPSPSHLHLDTPTRSRSRHESTPDISSSVSRQEEWHINTEDSRDEFMPIFTPCRAGFDADETRPSSGLGIGGVEDLADGGGQVTGDLTSSCESPVRRRSSRTRTTTTSPIMQANRWARASHDRQQTTLPPSPSLYDDDKSFVSGHRAYTEASHFDFDALNAELSPRAPRGTMSPLDQLHQGFARHGEQQQTTPILSTDSRFSGLSPSALSPYSAIHPRSASGRPMSRMVTTMHQVQDGVTSGWPHSANASPRSEMGLFDAVSAGSCFSGGFTTEDGTHELSASMSAVAARARLLQSVQEETSREQDRQERELAEHQRRAEEAERIGSACDPAVMSIIEEESHDYEAAQANEGEADCTVTAARAPHQAKKPQGLSIYVGNAGGSLGDGIVSPLTPPFTPAKTPADLAQSVRRYQHRYTGTTTSQQSSQSSTRMGAPSEESQDTVPELGTASSGSLSSAAGVTSPLKLRPLSLSTSNSVLGDGFDLRGSTSSAGDVTTKRLSSYRSSRGVVGSESSGSLSSSHRAYGAYSHLASALGLDNGPVTGPTGAASKRGSFIYKKPVAGGA